MNGNYEIVTDHPRTSFRLKIVRIKNHEYFRNEQLKTFDTPFVLPSLFFIMENLWPKISRYGIWWSELMPNLGLKVNFENRGNLMILTRRYIVKTFWPCIKWIIRFQGVITTGILSFLCKQDWFWLWNAPNLNYWERELLFLSCLVSFVSVFTQ